MDMKLRIDAESLAMNDYKKTLGQVITVHMLTGYKGDDSYDFDGGEFIVRVTETPETDLCHWVDEYLDPYWNVELVGNYPELSEHRSFWTFGPSYRIVNDAILAVDNNQAVPHDKH